MYTHGYSLPSILYNNPCILELALSPAKCKLLFLHFLCNLHIISINQEYNKYFKFLVH